MSESESDPGTSQFEEQSHNIITETPLLQQVSALRRLVGEVTARLEVGKLIHELETDPARRLEFVGEEEADVRSVLF